jgi:chromosome segregation ATPase
MLEKQDQYERGKQEMVDRLTESMVSLQKMGEHAARQVEIYWATRERFSAALEELQKINDSEWADESFRDELNKAVANIDSIRNEFVKAQATVEAVGGPVQLFDEQRPKSTTDANDEFLQSKGFGYWFKIGFAASIPLIAAILVAVVLMLIKGR